MNPWPPTGYKEMRLVDPFEIHVGPVFECGTRGARSFLFRVSEQHTNRRLVVHGGMLLTLADLTLGAAAIDACDEPSVTLGMQTQFLKSARIGEIIEVKPELVRRTRALLFIRGDFKVGGEVVFTANSVWKLLGRD